MSGLRWRVWVTFGLVAAGIGVPSPRPAAAATTRVVIGGMRFTPPRVEIAMGDSVLWEAADEGHTVTARDGSFDSSPRGLMAEGDQYRFRFRLPGTFAYFCRVHQTRGMQGEIVVVDPAAPTTTSHPADPGERRRPDLLDGHHGDDGADHDDQPPPGHQFHDEPERGDGHHGPARSAGRPPGATDPQSQRPDRRHPRLRNRPVRGAGRRPALGG